MTMQGDGATTGTDWRKAIRTFVTASTEPVTMYGIRDAILGRPTVTDGRRREYREWIRDSDAIIRTALALWQEGRLVIVTPADGENEETMTWVVAADVCTPSG